MTRGAVSVIVLLAAVLATAQGRNAGPGPDRATGPADNLVTENIPPIPRAVVEKADRYAEFRSATLADWQPTRREMLIGTRFGEVPEIHVVKAPGADRTQLTFFRDRVQGGR